jgi:threonine dehydrogenase-like Zn-dependent dehydrogenase
VRAMVFTRPGTVELLEVEEPSVGPGEVVVTVVACGICGSELHGISEDGFRRPPLIMGHEFAGRVLDGRSVAVNPIIHCGQCDMCAVGLEELCRKRCIIGVHRPGAFAERVAVPEASVYELPPWLPVARGALAEPLANAVHAWRLSGADNGARVGVIGSGGIGISVLLVAKYRGASVMITDLSSERRSAAERLGADAVGRTLEGEFDAIVDAVGAKATRRASIEHLRPGGTTVWVGLLDNDPGFDARDLVRAGKHVVGSFAYSREEFREAVALTGELDLGWARTFDLDEGPAVFGELMDGRADIVKALLQPR